MSQIDMIADIMKAELRQATTKFGSFHSTHEGYAVIKEEVDEMWDAIKNNNLEDACREAIQVGAMAMRFLFDMGFLAQVESSDSPERKVKDGK